MEQTELFELAAQLTTGFDGLQIEYEKLFGRYKALENKLSVARDQYNELAKLLGKTTTDTTPPRSLISTTQVCPKIEERPLSVLDILKLGQATNAAQDLQTAIEASHRLRQQLHVQKVPATGVKIWSGPSADGNTSSVKLPSIIESPMEQDFTIAGVPSRLGCPFASMSGKKLSSHAASVLSRYGGSHSPRDGRSVTRETASVVASSVSRVSRIDGRDSALQAKARRRSSIIDPIKAEICGMDSHDPAEQKALQEEPQLEDGVPSDKAAEPGVCPIRFLNQHSPEELAQYFEKHKHELPRSHEVCVRRYQSNEDQVRELDAKYSDVAQMIRGLGEKHQDYLPKDIDDADELQQPGDVATDGRIEKWADSLSAQAPVNDNESIVEDVVDDKREPRFERPLRDVRLGESPSRPWGIQVPAQYLEEVGSKTSSAPAQIKPETMPADHPPVGPEAAKGGVCPFASMTKKAAGNGAPAVKPPKQVHEQVEIKPNVVDKTEPPKPIPIPLIFNGPVVIGYGAEEAAKFLQALSFDASHKA